MTCHHYFPSPHLRPYIAYFWALESDEKKEANSNYSFVPDGYVDWVFHLNEPWEFPSGKTGQKFRSHIFGQSKKYIELKLPDGKLKLFGIKFQPWAAHKLWKMDMHDTTNQFISLSDFGQPGILVLEEKINAAKSMGEMILTAETFLEKKIYQPKKENLKWAVRHISHNSNFDGLFENISQRRLEQRFKKEIDISPKMLQRTVRINRVIQEIMRLPKPNFTDITYQFGYFDQSHFIREFKQFTGLSPSKFLQSISPSRDILNLRAG